MDTNPLKTPATLRFAEWRKMPASQAAREVHTRVRALSPKLQKAAVAWLKPEGELALDLASNVNQTAPLRGIPYFLKDLFDLAGVPTKAGSVFLDQVRPIPTHDSRIARRFHELGASCAGKSQLVEFASGLTGENPHYGDCSHPLFPDRLSGGSSSGSAALVAAGVVPLAIGTDTGGSVRVPAAFCGLYGFRLTPDDTYISDAFPLAPTMDTAGWFTANAADMLESWRLFIGGSGSSTEPRGCHLTMDALLPTAEREIATACDEAAARICPVADRITHSRLLESWENSVDAYITIGMSEAHAVHKNWLVPFRESYDPVIWQRFSDAGNYPAEKIQAARAKLNEVRSAWQKFFLEYDYLILPAAPCPAPRKADCTVELRRAIIRLTAPASLGGLPVLSIPVPLVSGLSAGLQIIVPAATSAVTPWILGKFADA